MPTLSANPIENPEVYNVIVVAGVISPGAMILSGGGRPYKWDIKDTAGAQGSTITYRGWKLGDDIECKFQFWQDQQIADFYSGFVPLLQYDATKQNPKPVQVYHPVLSVNDIYSVVVTEIGPLTNEGKGLWTVTVKMTEYRPPKKQNVTTTPDAAATTDDPETDPPVQDLQDQEIEDLAEEFADPGV